MSERIIMSKKIVKQEIVDIQAYNCLDDLENKFDLTQCFAKHFLEAFNGTIDDEGERLADWLIEITDTCDGKYGPIMEEHSFYMKEKEKIVASTVVALFRGIPLIIYVAVDPKYRGQGLAKKLLKKKLNSFCNSKHQEVFLVVTSGNLPAEMIYKKLGFKSVGTNWDHVLKQK